MVWPLTSQQTATFSTSYGNCTNKYQTHLFLSYTPQQYQQSKSFAVTKVTLLISKSMFLIFLKKKLVLSIDFNFVEICVVSQQLFFTNTQCETFLFQIQGLVKGAELFKSLLFWLAGEVSWLAIEVLSPCQK